MKLVKLPDGTWLDCSLVTGIKIEDALSLLPSGGASTTYSFVSLRGEGGALLLEFKCANRLEATEVSDSMAAAINAERGGLIHGRLRAPASQGGSLPRRDWLGLMTMKTETSGCSFQPDPYAIHFSDSTRGGVIIELIKRLEDRQRDALYVISAAVNAAVEDGKNCLRVPCPGDAVAGILKLCGYETRGPAERAAKFGVIEETMLVRWE